MFRTYKHLISAGAAFGLIVGLDASLKCSSLPAVFKTIFSYTVSGALIAATAPVTAPIELLTDLKPLSYSLNIADKIVSRAMD
jgi:hypothetical protein